LAGKTGHQDIARRYALALFSLAREQNQLDAVSAEFDSLRKMLAGSADFRKFAGNPVLRRDAQAQALAAIADKAGFSVLTKKFLGTLAARRRLDILQEIAAAVLSEIARHKGEVTAEVVAAYALDMSQIDGIAAALKKTLGLTVRVNVREDAEIMGGLVITVGSRRIDSSVRSRLERLHRALKNPDTSKNKAKMREVA
jgi:F-type H+-transporting ATPase subunit delta